MSRVQEEMFHLLIRVNFLLLENLKAPNSLNLKIKLESLIVGRKA